MAVKLSEAEIKTGKINYAEREYVLTEKVLSIIVAKYAKSMRYCYHCGVYIQIGEKVMSKRGAKHRLLRHAVCPKIGNATHFPTKPELAEGAK